MGEGKSRRVNARGGIGTISTGHRYGAHRVSVMFLGSLLLVAVVSLFTASALADTPPTLTVEAPTEVAYTTAHVAGTVNPSGGPSASFWAFEVSTNPSEPGSWVPVVSGEISGAEAESSAPVAIGGTIEGLTPGTEYSVRLADSYEEFAGHIETEAPYQTFTTKAVAPPAVAIEAPSAVSGSSAHVSGTINPEAPAGNPAAFDVNWHFECIPQCGTPGGAIPADATAHMVSADVTGLEANTLYVVMLVASNAGGQEIAGPVLFTTGPIDPSVQELYAGGVDSSKETLAGLVNPHNSATTYQFQWGSTAAYGQTTPVAPQALGAVDDGVHPVTAALEGLQAESTYHYRLVATNTETSKTTVGLDYTFTTLAPAAAPATCSNARLRSGPSASLPECRAYEMVSAREKNGQDVATVVNGQPRGFVIFPQAGVTGDAFGYGSQNSTYGEGPIEGGALNQLHMSTRGANGWTDSNLSPRYDTGGEIGQGTVIEAFSDDLSKVLFAMKNPPLVQGASTIAANLYVRNGPGDYTLLTPFTPEGLTGGPVAADVGVASADMTHVAFETFIPRTLDTPAGVSREVYESVNGMTRLAAILPNGEPSSTGGSLGSGTVAFNVQTHPISEDGTRIYWNDSPSAGQFGDGHPAGRLFLRENGTSTVPVNASELPSPEPPLPAVFRGATPNGNVAFFTTPERLTEDSSAGGSSAGEGWEGLGDDLYRFDAGTGKVTDLTVDDNSEDANGASVKGIAGFADDGSRVYFVAGGVLDVGATSGAPNLYVWEAGHAHFIATLAGGSSDEQVYMLSHIFEPNTRVTPSGHAMAFVSTARLTAYDNANHSEVYLYDAVSRQLRCVSCGTQGAVATADAALATVFASSLKSHVPHNLSDDGSRVFFETGQSLVPHDGNGKYDVYEYEDGRVVLLSTGQSGSETAFADATPDGHDVFFLTRDRLVQSDIDENLDIYDAREAGGFEERVVTAGCEGEACRAGLAQAPPTPALATIVPRGAGQAVPALANSKAKKKKKKKKSKKRQHRRSRKCAKRRCVSKAHARQGRGGHRG